MKAVLLLIRAVVFLVYNNEARSRERRKDGRSSADNNRRLTAASLSPVRATGLVREIRVQGDDGSAETMFEPS